MGSLFSWTALALITLPPTILLACVGLAFLVSLVKYNLPVLPHKAHGEHQDSKVVEGRHQLPCHDVQVVSKPGIILYKFSSVN